MTQDGKKRPTQESRLSSIAIQAGGGRTVEQFLVVERIKDGFLWERKVSEYSTIITGMNYLNSNPSSATYQLHDLGRLVGVRFLHLQNVGDNNCFIGSIVKTGRANIYKASRIMPGTYYLSICFKKNLNRSLKNRKKISFEHGEK